MFIDFIVERAKAQPDKTAVVWNGSEYSYAWLAGCITETVEALRMKQVHAGDVVVLDADFSPYAMAMFLALLERGCILVPLQHSLLASKKDEFASLAQVEKHIAMDGESWELSVLREEPADHAFITSLRKAGHPGLLMFSSGSTGNSKAMVHDVVPFLEKFRASRHAYRMIAFMLFDHIGGINTMLYALSNGGCLVTLQTRTPREVCELISRYQVELLPTSPTFLNLLLLSGVHHEYDLGSLHTITYGSELMSEHTLKSVQAAFPSAKLLQTYGLSEVGILRSKSETSDSLWVKIGGEGVQTRVVNDMLEIKTPSAMLGYLNAPSPFTEDGWFMTGDMVEVKGEYFRFLGRKSEIIMVGGEKVYPAEIENILQRMEGVLEVAVKGEQNPITGQMVKAVFHLEEEEDLPSFRKRMRAFCQDRLPSHKIPQKVEIRSAALHNERFKKMR